MTVLQTSPRSGKHQRRVSRRTLLKGSTALALGAAALRAAGAGAREQAATGTEDSPLPKGRVIDCHAYLTHRSRATDDGTVDMAVAVAGADRVVFGTDSSMTACVGKIRGAEWSPQDKQKILGGNMTRLLGRRKV
jgi:hypothetical protein